MIRSSRAADIPLSVNTYDYSSDATDPSVPLPSSLNITLNAPLKVTFPPLGAGAFTSTYNSFGLSANVPVRPFQVSNPTRILLKAFGIPTDPSNSTLRLSRESDSPATVFDTGYNSNINFTTKLYETGQYLRSDYTYLFACYGASKKSSGNVNTYRTMLLVYSQLKFLPQTFSFVGLAIDLADYHGQDFGTFDFTSITSPIPLELIKGSPLEFGIWSSGGNVPQGTIGCNVAIGVVSAAFNL